MTQDTDVAGSFETSPRSAPHVGPERPTWCAPEITRLSLAETLSAFNTHTDGHHTGSVPS